MDIRDETYVEWRAWGLLCEFLGRAGVDVNEPVNDPLVCAIRAWGELLVELRLTQTDTQVECARGEALGALLNSGSSG